MASTRYGLGSGTPDEELARWLKEAGRITVHSEGLQHTLFETEPVEMYRLYSHKSGDSLLITAETAQRYGLIPSPVKDHSRAQSTPDLFTPPQGSLF